MRTLFLIILVFILAACSDLGGVQSSYVPQRVTLGGLSGSLSLSANPYAAWKITTEAAWLEVSPSQGIGPQTVQLRVKADQLAAEQSDNNQYTAELSVSGDLKGTITVRLPLVKVTGHIVETATAQQAPDLPTAPLRQSVAQASPQSVLVKYRVGSRLSLPSGAKIITQDAQSRVSKLSSPNPQALLERLRLDPNVEWAELNGTVTAQGVPSRVMAQGEPGDQFYPRQWHLRTTGARFSYLQSYPNAVTVAVIDTGVRYDHPDLEGRLVEAGQGAYDFVEGDPDATDPGDTASPRGGSHGTHVTGLIAANAGTFAAPCADCSNSGVVGTAYSAPVKVLPLRVLDQDGNGTFENVALAIRYAAGLPVSLNGQTLQTTAVQIINLSLGSVQFSNAMCDAVDAAVKQGVLVVAAAGNYQHISSLAGKLVYPAACPGAISVGATDLLNRVTYYSQQNSEVDIVAPGGDNQQDANQDGYPDGILSTTWNYQTGVPNYTYYVGTSQATPQVAAALALIISSGKATPSSAFELLKASAADLGTPGRDDLYGNGLISLTKLFAWTLPPGSYSVNLRGPVTRQLPVSGNTFETYLIPGSYDLLLCRDDSGNLLCEPGEPQVRRQVVIPAGTSFDLGELSLNP